MKLSLTILLLLPFCGISTGYAQSDVIMASCDNISTVVSDDYIELKCSLFIEQAVAIPNITTVGVDHKLSGYYRWCWDESTETYAYSPTWSIDKPYPGPLVAGRVQLVMVSSLGANKWYNESLGRHNHWDPTLLNWGQFWYTESGVQVNYGSPLTKSITYTPSPCT